MTVEVSRSALRAVAYDLPSFTYITFAPSAATIDASGLVAMCWAAMDAANQEAGGDPHVRLDWPEWSEAAAAGDYAFEADGQVHVRLTRAGQAPARRAWLHSLAANLTAVGLDGKLSPATDRPFPPERVVAAMAPIADNAPPIAPPPGEPVLTPEQKREWTKRPLFRVGT